MFRHLIIAAVAWNVCSHTFALAQPVVTAVVNGASWQPLVARGTIVSIFGSRLAASPASASEVPLPARLAGTTVTVGDVGVPAPLYFVSPGQINAQIPFEVLGIAVSLTVATAEGRSRPVTLSLASAAPGIFTRNGDGKGRALALARDFQPADAPAPGETLVLYASGLGPTDPPSFSGSAPAAVEPLNRVVTTPEVIVGEFPARVEFAGLAPGFVGVYQLNVIPDRIVSDRVYIRQRGIRSNVAEIGMRAGQNVANAKGSIELIYPKENLPTLYTPMPVVARITASMDILPAARPFVIAAVSDAGASLITVDPPSGTFEASMVVPGAPARAGDFSASGLPVIDLATCHDEGGVVACLPFPGAIIPASRIPPDVLRAFTLLPLPNVPVPNSATGLLVTRGTVRPGSSFVIDQTTNSQLSFFGDFVSIPVPPPSAQTGTVKLFIDGMLVASVEVHYDLTPVFDNSIDF